MKGTFEERRGGALEEDDKESVLVGQLKEQIDELKAENEAYEVKDGRLQADLAFLQRTLKIAEVLNNHQEAEIRLLKEAATTDNLTGVKNRRGLQESINERSVELEGNVVVILADANKFKPLNDEHGHEAGDAVLKEAVRHLRELVRETDVVARIGGDEFVIVCFGADEKALEEKFGRGIEFDMNYKSRTFSVSLSTGVAARMPGEKVEDTVRRADYKMYEQKRESGNAR